MSRKEKTALICVGLALAILAGCHFTPRPPRRTREQVKRDEAMATYARTRRSLANQKDTRYIDHKGFFNTFANYAVTFADRDRQLFIDEDWKLENWGCEDQLYEYCSTLVQKKGKAYRGIRFVDRNDDGTEEKEWEYFFDLKLRNLKDSSEIWVSTYDIPGEAGETMLDVFLDNYVDSLTGTELQMAGDPRGYGTVKERKFVTMIKEKKATTLGPYEAVQAEIAISDIDKLRLDESHVQARVRVLITRVDCDDRLMIQGEKSPIGLVTTSGKALMVVGYYSAPGFFESNLEGFASFLKRFVFKKKDAGDGKEADLPKGV